MATTDKRIALVTGGNKGIGFQVVRQLAQQGVHVLLGARDESRADAAIKSLKDDGFSVDKVIIDVTSRPSIEAAVKHISETHGRLDILVNNAGVLSVKDGSSLTVEQDILTETMNINFFGVVATTQAFLPLLRKSEAASIVNVSSTLGSMSLLGNPESVLYGYHCVAYSASKAALNLYTVKLSVELKDTKIVANVVSPGHCDTDLSQHTGQLTAAQGAEGIVKYALQTTASGEFYETGELQPW